MRAKTKGKHEMGKRFAVVVGVAAVGVMALGAQTVIAQTAAQPPAVVKYDTKLTITHEGCCSDGRRVDRNTHWHGYVQSDRDRNPGYDPANAVRECMRGRRVILFQQQPGADRKLGTGRNVFHPGWEMGGWGAGLAPWRGRVYARVTPKVGDGFVCRADRSRTIINGNLCHPSRKVHSAACGNSTKVRRSARRSTAREPSRTGGSEK